MQYLSTHDFILIRRMSLIGDYDRTIVAELYQPLISHQGLAFYLTLDVLSTSFSPDEAMQVATLINHTQMTINDLSLAKARLEAIGLIKSYKKTQADYDVHILELYAPKTPASFFDDVILRGILTQYIGEAMVQKWRMRYTMTTTPTDYEDTTASFGEIFHPDFTLPSFNGTREKALLERHSIAMATQFDRRIFLEEITKKSQIKPALFTEAILDQLDGIANLYGIDELAMAELTLATFIGDKEELLDFGKLKEMAALETKFAFAKTRRKELSKVSSSTSKAKKIQLMEGADPKTYFRYRNLNNAPASADLKVINDVQQRYDLPFPVINALIDYVLERANLTFPRPLVEKIAASLARAQVTSAVDAMEYLVATTRKKAKSTLKEAVPTNVPTKTAEEEIDLDAMLKELADERKGQHHG